MQVRVRFELKSPVKTIEDFLRRFTPSRRAAGCNGLGSLAANRGPNKSSSGCLSGPARDSALLGPEERPGQPVALASNGISEPGNGASRRTARGQAPELRYEAESPDEAALVYAARAYSCALVDRLPDHVSVQLPQLGRLTFELLHTLGFDSVRKRMSVVIRHPLTDEISVYTKGADSVLMDLLLPCSPGASPVPGGAPRGQACPQPLPTGRGIVTDPFWKPCPWGTCSPDSSSSLEGGPGGLGPSSPWSRGLWGCGGRPSVLF